MRRAATLLPLARRTLLEPPHSTTCTRPLTALSAHAASTSAPASPGEAPTPSSAAGAQQQHAGANKPIVPPPPSFALTLERGVGKAYGAEAELAACGAFAAEVFPDLPLATTWQTLFKALSEGLGGAAASGPAYTQYTTTGPAAKKVLTVAANLRSMTDIEQRLRVGTGAEAATPVAQRADALLCLSGSHPVRSLPLVAGMLRSSLDTLRSAERMRCQGAIPRSTELWVVANPNTEPDTQLLQRKAALGACTVITQPPLDWPAFERWLNDFDRAGLGQQLRLVVGHPVISSATNARFWLALSNCIGSREGQAVVEAAAVAEAQGKEALRLHCLRYNQQLLERVRGSGLAAGMHVMPITQAAKKIALQVIGEAGLLPET